MSTPTTGQPLRLHPLTYLEDRGEVVVGRTDIDSYGVFPPDGAALLRQLAAGLSVGDAARWYADVYGEQVDMAEFVGLLDELGFLVKGHEAETPRSLRWQRLGTWAFSPAAWVSYAFVIVGALVVMALRPRLAPHPTNVFFTHYMSVLELVLFLGQLPLMLVHEVFHVLAGRRLGLRTSMRIGRRLYYLVFETAMDGLVAVPRRSRYLPMLAGMLADLLIISILTLVAAATMSPDGDVPLIGGICLALAFSALLRVIWQLYFYLRTDIYYVVVTVLGCIDLQAAARHLLANNLRRLVRRRQVDESVLHPRDRAVARWYAWLMAAGYAFSIGTLVLAVRPVAERVLSLVFDRLRNGGQPWQGIADSATFLALNLAQVIIVVTLAVRSRRRSRAAGQPPG